jgi:hypothetical protein
VGRVGAADLIGQDAQKVQRFNMIGLATQNLAIDDFRFSEATCLVMLKSEMQGAGKSWICGTHDRMLIPARRGRGDEPHAATMGFIF